MKHLINIDLSSYGWDIDDSMRWLGVDSLETEGSTLSELLDNCVIFTCDQDGGEGPQFEFGGTPGTDTIEDLITNEFFKQTGVRK